MENDDEENIDIPLPDENSSAGSPSPKKTIVTDLPQDILGSPNHHDLHRHSHIHPTTTPRKFEIFLARKLLSRNGGGGRSKNISSSSLHNYFIKMDIDKDGFITVQDLHRAFHNVLGIDLTEEQLEVMFCRMETIMDEKGDGSSLSYNATPRGGGGEKDETNSIISSPSSSMKSYPSSLLNLNDSFCCGSGRVPYKNFKRYVLQTADYSSKYTPSEIEYSAAIDLQHVDDDNDDDNINTEDLLRLSNISQETNTSALTTSTTRSSLSSSRRHSPHKNKSSKLLSIVPPPHAVTVELRIALRRLIQQHSNKALGRGGGMAETTLFLEMDTHRDGYVTPFEFQELIASWGLVLSEEQVRIILGKHYKKEGINLKEFIQFIDEMDEHTHGLSNPMPWELMDTENETKRLIAKERVEKLYTQRELDSQREEEERQKKKRKHDGKTNGQLAQLLSEKIYTQFSTVLQAFTKFNQDGQHRGKLSVLELQNVMNHLGLDVSEGRVVEFVKRFDGDGDGLLGKGDFVKLVGSGNSKEETEETMVKGENKDVSKDTVVKEKEMEEGSKKSAASSPLPASHVDKSNKPLQEKAASVDGKLERNALSIEEGKENFQIPSTTMSQNTTSHVLSESSSITTTTTAFESTTKTEEEQDKEEIIKNLIKKFQDKMQAQSARKAFEMMDVNHSKYLNVDQLKVGYQKLGIEISEDQANQIMNLFDPESTGEMRFHQFLKMISSKLIS